MNGTLTLKNTVMINGDKITEMKYDTNEIDGVLFATAEAKRKAAAGMKNLSVSAAAEFDFGLHLYLGYAAIVAVNPTYDFSDLERMKGADVVEVMAHRPKFYAEIGVGTTGKRLRRAYRDYARVYHTSTTELEKKRVTDFIIEYAEAAEDLAAEKKRAEKNRPLNIRRPKHTRR